MKAKNGPKCNTPHGISKPTKWHHKANYTKTNHTKEIKAHGTQYNKTPEVSPKSIKWQQQARPSIKWTKQHIDAYLTIAEVAMEWLDAYLALSDIIIVQRNEAAG
jgi:hypothetical protein